MLGARVLSALGAAASAATPVLHLTGADIAAIISAVGGLFLSIAAFVRSGRAPECARPTADGPCGRARGHRGQCAALPSPAETFAGGGGI